MPLGKFRATFSAIFVVGNLFFLLISFLALIVLSKRNVQEWLQFVVIAAPITSYFSIRFFEMMSVEELNNKEVISKTFSYVSILVLLTCFIFMYFIILLVSTRYGNMTTNNGSLAIGIVETASAAYFGVVEKRLRSS